MNIFVLHEDPWEAAQLQCDKHVVKMCLETAQLLSTNWPSVGCAAPYKPTHYNHPCSRWVRIHHENYAWLVEHFRALLSEYAHRYGKRHKCRDVLDLIEETHPAHLLEPPDDILDMDFVYCGVESCRRASVVDSYRELYKLKAKTIDMRWTKREKPEWMP